MTRRAVVSLASRGSSVPASTSMPIRRVPPDGAAHPGRTLPRATVSSRKSTRRRCRRITWFLLHLMTGLVGLKCNEDPLRDNEKSLAGVAVETSSPRRGDLARLLSQGIRQTAHCLQRCGGGSALLWLD